MMELYGLTQQGMQPEKTWYQDTPPDIFDEDGDGDGFIEFAESDTTNSMTLDEGDVIKAKP